LKAVLKAIAASELGKQPGVASDATGSKGDWMGTLAALSRHPANHPLRAKLLAALRAMTVNHTH